MNIGCSTCERGHAGGIHHTTGCAIQRVQRSGSNRGVGQLDRLSSNTSDFSRGSVKDVLNVRSETRNGGHCTGIHRNSGDAVDRFQLKGRRTACINRDGVSVVGIGIREASEGGGITAQRGDHNACGDRINGIGLRNCWRR